MKRNLKINLWYVWKNPKRKIKNNDFRPMNGVQGSQSNWMHNWNDDILLSQSVSLGKINQWKYEWITKIIYSKMNKNINNFTETAWKIYKKD